MAMWRLCSNLDSVKHFSVLGPFRHSTACKNGCKVLCVHNSASAYWKLTLEKKKNKTILCIKGIEPPHISFNSRHHQSTIYHMPNQIKILRRQISQPSRFGIIKNQFPNFSKAPGIFIRSHIVNHSRPTTIPPRYGEETRIDRSIETTNLMTCCSSRRQQLFL